MGSILDQIREENKQRKAQGVSGVNAQVAPETPQGPQGYQNKGVLGVDVGGLAGKAAGEALNVGGQGLSLLGKALDIGQEKVTRPATGWVYKEAFTPGTLSKTGIMTPEQEQSLAEFLVFGKNVDDEQVDRIRQSDSYTEAYNQRWEGNPWGKVAYELVADPLNLTMGAGKVLKGARALEDVNAARRWTKVGQGLDLVDRAQALPLTLPAKGIGKLASKTGIDKPIRKGLEVTKRSQAAKRTRDLINALQRSDNETGGTQLSSYLGRDLVNQITDMVDRNEDVTGFITQQDDVTLARGLLEAQETNASQPVADALGRELVSRGGLEVTEDGVFFSRPLVSHVSLDRMADNLQLAPAERQFQHDFIDIVADAAVASNPDRFGADPESVYRYIRFEPRGATELQDAAETINDGSFGVVFYTDNDMTKPTFTMVTPFGDIDTFTHEVGHLLHALSGDADATRIWNEVIDDARWSVDNPGIRRSDAYVKGDREADIKSNVREEFAEGFSSDVDFVLVNIDDPRLQDIGRRYNALVTPQRLLSPQSGELSPDLQAMTSARFEGIEATDVPPGTAGTSPSALPNLSPTADKAVNDLLGMSEDPSTIGVLQNEVHLLPDNELRQVQEFLTAADEASLLPPPYDAVVRLVNEEATQRFRGGTPSDLAFPSGIKDISQFTPEEAKKLTSPYDREWDETQFLSMRDNLELNEYLHGSDIRGKNLDDFEGFDIGKMVSANGVFMTQDPWWAQEFSGGKYIFQTKVNVPDEAIIDLTNTENIYRFLVGNLDAPINMTNRIADTIATGGAWATSLDDVFYGHELDTILRGSDSAGITGKSTLEQWVMEEARLRGYRGMRLRDNNDYSTIIFNPQDIDILGVYDASGRPLRNYTEHLGEPLRGPSIAMPAGDPQPLRTSETSPWAKLITLPNEAERRRYVSSLDNVRKEQMLDLFNKYFSARDVRQNHWLQNIEEILTESLPPFKSGTDLLFKMNQWGIKAEDVPAALDDYMQGQSRGYFSNLLIEVKDTMQNWRWDDYPPAPDELAVQKWLEDTLDEMDNLGIENLGDAAPQYSEMPLPPYFKTSSVPADSSKPGLGYTRPATDPVQFAPGVNPRPDLEPTQVRNYQKSAYVSPLTESIVRIADQLRDPRITDDAIASVESALAPVMEANKAQLSALNFVANGKVREHIERALVETDPVKKNAAIADAVNQLNLTWSAFGVEHPVMGRILKGLGVEDKNPIGVRRSVGRTFHGNRNLDTHVQLLQEAGSMEEVQKFQADYDNFVNTVNEVVTKYIPDAVKKGEDSVTIHDVIRALDHVDEKEATRLRKFMDEYDLPTSLDLADNLTSKTLKQIQREGIADAFHRTLMKELGVKAPARNAFTKQLGKIPNGWREQALLSVRYHAQNVLDMTLKSIVYGINPLRGSQSAITLSERLGIDVPDAVRVYDLRSEIYTPEFSQQGTPSVLGGIPVAGRVLGPIVDFNRSIARGMEDTFRMAAWAATLRDFMRESFMPNYLGELSRIERAYKVDLSDVRRVLDERGGEIGEEELYNLVLSKTGDVRSAREASVIWGRGLDEASDAGIKRANDVHFDFMDERVVEEKFMIRNWAPFHFWATRNVPFYLQTMTQNPEMLRAWQTYDQISDDERKRMGLTARFMNTLPGPDVPVLSPILEVFFGEGTAYFNPLVVMSLADQFKPRYVGEDTPLIGRGLEEAGRVGLAPAPWINVGLSAVGTYGADAEAPNFLRHGRLAEVLTGVDVEQPIQDVHNKILETVTGQPKHTLTGDPYMDYQLAKRIKEMSVEETGEANNPAYVQAIADPDSEIFQRALADVQKQRLGNEVMGLFNPFPTKYLTDTEATIRQSASGLGNVDYTPELTRTLGEQGHLSTALWGTSNDLRQDQISAGFAAGEAERSTEGGPVIHPSIQRVLGQKATGTDERFPWFHRYLAWRQTQPQGADLSIERFLRENPR